jgi:hypothetical protein
VFSAGWAITRRRWLSILPGAVIVVVAVAMGAVFSTQAIESTVRGLIVDISKDLGVATGVEAVGPLGLGEGVDVEMLLEDPEKALSKLTEGTGAGPNITSIAGIDPETGEPTGPGTGQGATTGPGGA